MGIAVYRGRDSEGDETMLTSRWKTKRGGSGTSTEVNPPYTKTTKRFWGCVRQRLDCHIVYKDGNEWFEVAAVYRDDYMNWVWYFDQDFVGPNPKEKANITLDTPAQT